jgi:type IV pilus assembly protein PilW
MTIQTKNESGFTLIEIMIALLISSVILGAVFMTFSSQQKSYVINDRLTEVQQNLRAATIIMAKDIREAGCDPTGKSGAGVLIATPGRFQFTKDIAGNTINPAAGDGDLDDSNENISLGFSTTNDSDTDGIVNIAAGAANLGRDLGKGAGFQPIAENIQAIEFNYLLDDGTASNAPTSSQLNDIIAVQISVLARASSPDQNFSSTLTYTTASGTVWGPYADNYRRRFVSTTIQCRNLGY